MPWIDSRAPFPHCDLVLDLLEIFHQINRDHFDSFMDPPELRWNPRLRASAGRFVPGHRSYWGSVPPAIEVASYLLEEPNSITLVHDTVGHEMIHMWLWSRRRPYGHTPEFMAKMRQMGVSRYNPVPRTRPHRYAYRCISCQREFRARKNHGKHSSASSCDLHNGRKYDVRFKLVFERVLVEIQPESSVSAMAVASAVPPAAPSE
jgi:predicted SprT family Zn-dependent metalloprotease